MYSVNNSKQFTYASLIDGIFKDMESLGMEIREIKPDEKLLLEEYVKQADKVMYQEKKKTI